MAIAQFKNEEDPVVIFYCPLGGTYWNFLAEKVMMFVKGVQLSRHQANKTPLPNLIALCKKQAWDILWHPQPGSWPLQTNTCDCGMYLAEMTAFLTFLGYRVFLLFERRYPFHSGSI